jgi:hypothetical protein
LKAAIIANWGNQLSNQQSKSLTSPKRTLCAIFKDDARRFEFIAYGI